jgi:hypothetical protein
MVAEGGAFMPAETNYVALDPSCFVSVSHLRDMVQILKEGFPRAKVALPTYLQKELILMMRHKNEVYLSEILRAWLPPRTKTFAVPLARGLPRDREYLTLLRKFFAKFQPIPVRNVIGDIEHLGEESLDKSTVLEKLGFAVGDIVFELLALSFKAQSYIVMFWDSMANLVVKIGVKVIRGPSKLKLEVKKRARVRKALRICGYALSLDAVKQIIAYLIMGHVSIPFGDIGVGLLVLANG